MIKNFSYFLLIKKKYNTDKIGYIALNFPYFKGVSDFVLQNYGKYILSFQTSDYIPEKVINR